MRLWLKLYLRRALGAVCVAGVILPLASWGQTGPTVRDTVFSIQERFLRDFSIEELDAMDSAAVLENISGDERYILGTGFVRFSVNVPVVVSVMREAHSTDLFWLEDLGFEKTDLKVQVRYENEWEVWQAEFPAGKVGLGVNELERGGSNESYAVAVTAANASDNAILEISDLYHPSYAVSSLEVDVPAWADEPSRYFVAVPDELRGQKLVQLLRVRRNDGQLVDYNRLTKWPSSPEPDQVALTLGEDPRTSVVVQWRTSLEENTGQVLYQEKSRYTGFGPGDDFSWASSNGPLLVDSPRDEILAGYDSLDDYPGGLLDLRPEPGNDPEVNRHIVTLAGLKPGTRYVYVVGNGQDGGWSEPMDFTTDGAREPGEDAFAFMYMGDVQHGFEQWKYLVDTARESHPEAGFVVMAGDMVNRGQQRDDWDDFFHAAEGFYSGIPIVPVVGNHERNGLDPRLFLDHFKLPENGPEGMEEQVYSFEYGNAFFAVVDGNRKDPEELRQQAQWLDMQLAQTSALWKFVSIHQPVYGSRPSQDEPELRAAFVPVFDRHRVDLMLQGHTHGYMRSRPMKNGRVVPEGEGTIYLVANAGGKHYDVGGFEEKYGVEPAVLIGNLSSYQVFEIDKGRLEYRSYDVDGNLVDEFDLEKESAVTPGDVDGNGVVDRHDVRALRAYLRSGAGDCATCDIDGDGVITISDARLLAIAVRCSEARGRGQGGRACRGPMPPGLASITGR